MCRTAGCTVRRLRRTVVWVVYVGMKVNANEKSERPWSSAHGRLELLAVCVAVCWMEAWAVECGPRQTLRTKVKRYSPCPQGAHSLGVDHTVLPTLQQWQELQIQVGGREQRKKTSSAWEVQEGVADHGAEASRLNRSLLERETGKGQSRQQPACASLGVTMSQV